MNQLCNPETSALALGSARHRHAAGDWFALLFLLMPDHLHALVAFPPHKAMVEVVPLWKGYLARMAGIRWQRGFFDHRLRCAESWEAKALYIRMNPVRAGLIANPENWPYQWQPK